VGDSASLVAFESVSDTQIEDLLPDFGEDFTVLKKAHPGRRAQLKAKGAI